MQEKSYLESEIQSELGFEEIIGQSPALREVLKKARVVAPTDSTVLLLGETGTGKELMARSVHSLSSRRDKTVHQAELCGGAFGIAGERPTLDDKVDIVQNAIDLAHAMGVADVRVAILSAMETVNAKVPSTIEAAALCKMADRGQITGAVLDGPLALDNAISAEAAAIKRIASPVAGRANILVVPDLEAGNMLAKSLSFLAHADAAGIVLGARVPIILTSRADLLLTRLASCAVAVMVAAARRRSAAAAIR